ncbi:MAG: plastoquinol--plastocyanin reductase [Calditrichaeota bacterium]|nr:MAG: plastoquinol--plastocyanin reductase [Calditrichota bacterium]
MALDRRKFINFLLGTGVLGWLGSTLYPLISYLIPPKVPEATVNSVKAGPLADLPPNSGKIIKFGRKPVILVHTESGELRAFSATCTHLDCIVQYRPDLKHIWCACHNGHYDLQGQNISGPPPKPLTEYQVQVVNDEIIVSRPQNMS